MYKSKKRTLKSFLNSSVYSDELFSRNSMNTIIRALLEPVANQNAASLIFTRFKNKDGLEGLIKRLEYCTNVEMVDVTSPSILIRDDYIELEFIVFTSARYNFVLIWDYSLDENKNYTKGFFLANSRNVNDVYEVLQNNMTVNYRDKFYLHKPERRENELLNEALFNVFKKLNNSIEENSYKESEDFVVDLIDDNDTDEKIKEISHEIKNQLSVLDVYTKIIEKQFGSNKNTDVIKKAVSMIYFKLNELKNFETTQIKEVILQDIINESLDMFQEVVKQNNNKLVYENKHKFDLKVFADENKLLSVLNNIVKNANESTENDTISCSIELEGDLIHLDIKNHGPKIENKEQIFEKGFTTKQKGTGLGLYICRNYIEEFKGTLELLNSDENETTFRITLPFG